MDTITLDDIRESAEYLINNRPPVSVREYLRDHGDCGDDSPIFRYPAADDLYDLVEGAAEYDAIHGTDDGVSDQEIRVPAYAAIHEVLAQAWHEKHGG